MPSVNRVLLGEEVLIDISNDTITAETVLSGYVGHDKSGAQITGTAGAYFDDTTTVIPSSQASINGTVTTLA